MTPLPAVDVITERFPLAMQESAKQETYGHYTISAANKNLIKIDAVTKKNMIIDPLAFSSYIGVTPEYQSEIIKIISYKIKFHFLSYLIHLEFILSD